MLPTLTLAMMTFRRPWYGLQTLSAIVQHIQYDGDLRYLIVDGGSEQRDLDMYEFMVKDYPHEFVNVANSDVADMLNNVANHSGEVWLTALDDFVPMQIMNLTHDVEFLLENEDVGHIRYGNMNGWDVPSQKVYAELRNVYRVHYWVFDKARTTASTMWTMGFGMTHRRMWDAYGPLALVGPHQPGYAENQLNRMFMNKEGPTVAIPMRIGQESDMKIPVYQPIAHIGHVRTDEYAMRWNDRWGAT